MKLARERALVFDLPLTEFLFTPKETAWLTGTEGFWELVRANMTRPAGANMEASTLMRPVLWSPLKVPGSARVRSKESSRGKWLTPYSLPISLGTTHQSHWRSIEEAQRNSKDGSQLDTGGFLSSGRILSFPSCLCSISWFAPLPSFSPFHVAHHLFQSLFYYLNCYKIQL